MHYSQNGHWTRNGLPPSCVEAEEGGAMTRASTPLVFAGSAAAASGSEVRPLRHHRRVLRVGSGRFIDSDVVPARARCCSSRVRRPRRSRTPSGPVGSPATIGPRRAASCRPCTIHPGRRHDASVAVGAALARPVRRSFPRTRSLMAMVVLLAAPAQRFPRSFFEARTAAAAGEWLLVSLYWPEAYWSNLYKVLPDGSGFTQITNFLHRAHRSVGGILGARERLDHHGRDRRDAAWAVHDWSP
jgi:hypothetical protein